MENGIYSRIEYVLSILQESVVYGWMPSQDESGCTVRVLEVLRDQLDLLYVLWFIAENGLEK